MKKAIAVGLSMAMVLGMSVPAMAEDTGTDINAPIYSFDVTDVIVPTTYAVAFNPEGLQVKVGTGSSQDQILSKSFGIINKSNKNKVITATLTVADQNGEDSGVVFVDSADEVRNAKDGEYKIHLTVVPADTTEVKIGTASADKDTAAAALADVAMTKAATGKEITLKSGINQVGFMLEKATYTPKATGGLELGTGTTNDVQNNFELTGLAAAGKGITAFAFGGEMNGNAEWSKLTSGIKITAVYTNETAPSDVEVIDGTGALVELVSEPTFTTGSAVGTISYTAGKGDNALGTITKIEMTNSIGTFDGYHANGSLWPAATDASGVITLPSAYMGYYTKEITDVDELEATVTYTTAGGDTKTTTVNVKLR